MGQLFMWRRSQIPWCRSLRSHCAASASYLDLHSKSTRVNTGRSRWKQGDKAQTNNRICILLWCWQQLKFTNLAPLICISKKSHLAAGRIKFFSLWSRFFFLTCILRSFICRRFNVGPGASMLHVAKGILNTLKAVTSRLWTGGNYTSADEWREFEVSSLFGGPELLD